MRGWRLLHEWMRWRYVRFEQHQRWHNLNHHRDRRVGFTSTLFDSFGKHKVAWLTTEPEGASTLRLPVFYICIYCIYNVETDRMLAIENSGYCTCRVSANAHGR